MVLDSLVDEKLHCLYEIDILHETSRLIRRLWYHLIHLAVTILIGRRVVDSYLS
jgi:hypothetical protein